MIRSHLLTLVLLVAPAAPAGADVVVLRNGSRLAFPGCVEDAADVVCTTDAGTVAFSRDQVLQVLRGEAAESAVPTWRAEPDDDSPAGPIGSGAGALELTLEAFRLEQAGDWDAAESAYRRALAEVPPPVAAQVGLGRVLLRQGKAHEAIEELETLIASRPQEAQAHLLLGEALDAVDRLEDAVRAWAQAAALDEAYASRYREGQRELETQLDYRRTLAPHFTVTYDGDRDEELGGAILKVLEDAFDEFVNRFEHYPENTILVTLYSRRDFEEVTGAGPEVGGLFDGKVRLPIGGLRRVTGAVEHVARHELAHAFLHDKGRGHVPRWLHEGLAQRVEGRPGPDTRRGLLREVEAQDEPLAWAAEFSYAKALSLVGYLEEEYGKGRVLDLVTALADGRGEDAAFREVFGVDAERVLGEWLAWLGWDAP